MNADLIGAKFIKKISLTHEHGLKFIKKISLTHVHKLIHLNNHKIIGMGTDSSRFEIDSDDRL